MGPLWKAMSAVVLDSIIIPLFAEISISEIARHSSFIYTAASNHEGLMMKSFSFAVAPGKLWQAINPWTFYQQGAQFGFINIDLGSTPAPQTEQTILDEVGSYGRQIGRLGDALEVLLRHVPLQNLSKDETDALDVLKGQLAEIRQIKEREGRKQSPHP